MQLFRIDAATDKRAYRVMYTYGYMIVLVFGGINLGISAEFVTFQVVE